MSLEHVFFSSFLLMYFKSKLKTGEPKEAAGVKAGVPNMLIHHRL